ncbi:reprolysin-like metallopeptidase [Flavobacterium sp.]|uniref:reprolysin-like metallopeptidase n=1 Tax=Flavobacterium sp. TaxID=239 RepID=UPI00286CCFC5|nr:zinc-dependent metalloprotease family protein [Flavobacterium sp.]
MKYRLLIIILLVFESLSFAQNKINLWNNTNKKNNMVALDSRMQLPENKLFNLNLVGLKSNLKNAPSRTVYKKQSGTVLSIPNADGVLEKFSIYENSIMDPALAARYPGIKSYIGIGIDNPLATAYFSVSPLGFKSMVLSPDKSAVFIEPISADLETYTVYRKADKAQSLSRFECSVIDEVAPQIDASTLRPNADDGVLRTFRLAMSCTGEYTAYFGGTIALALAAINSSITRCNGVFEKDFGVRLIIIANTDLVIYTDASTDPYSPAANKSQWNAQLQSTLTSIIGESNYDIGHLFGATGGGGNAGCIGCICVNGSKGSGITSPADGIPTGDNFDIDYVAHEIGHQMGANHTFSMNNEGTGANMEPGSGSTIMGYAGITSQDVQPHSDAYFHAISIQQVTNNIKAKTCSVNIATGNATPTANAGLDYTIPKSTPFMLTGSGSDANGDVLTYNWEQFDNAASTETGANSVASGTRTSGPTFRSYNSSTSPIRYFPRMASVLTGALTTSGTEILVEALPSVARTMNFRLTVRDNKADGPANNSDDMIVNVNAIAGPFSVTSPNTAVSYGVGSSQVITWDVSGTTSNGVNCANVDILLSTDSGATWSTLIAATPNDGTQAVTIPNTIGTTNRIMVKGTNHIFFDVSNINFNIINTTPAPTISSISATSVCIGSTFTITGNNLTTTNAVTINGTAVASYVVNSNSQITVTAGNGTSGTVTVNTAGGTATSIASINIYPLPTTAWATSTSNVCQSTTAKTVTLAYTATTNLPTTYSITWSAWPNNSFTTVTNQSFSGTEGGGNITINVPANANFGTYTGTITVANGNGCISSALQTFTVIVNATPTGVSATASPTTLCAGNPININSSYNVASVTGTSTTISAFNALRNTGTSYTSIFPGTTITTWRNSTSTDDNLSNNQPIGFNFVYNGTSYSTFRVSTNGFVTFDNASTATGSGASPAAYSYTNNWTTAASGLIVAPNWDDLRTSGNLGTVADLNNSINYTTSGTAGTRILTVEWKNMKDFSTSSAASYNWQIKFYESDNHIEFVYGTMTQTAASVSYSLGLSAATVSTTPISSQLLSQTTANTGTFGFTNQNSLATITSSNTTISFYTPLTPVYSWTGPNSFTSSEANPIITSTTSSASGTYNLIVSNSVNGCQSAQVSSANVSVNERPTAAINGTATICNGGSSTINISVTGSGTISGTLSPGAIPFSGTAPTISVNVTPTSNTTYSVATLSNASCTSIASDLTGTRIINVNARPTATITGTATICNGGSSSISISVTGSGTISGTLSPGAIPFSGTAPTINVNVTPTSNTTYSVATLSNASCISIASDLTGTRIINVNARPTSAISGTATICNGGSTPISISVTGSGTISGTLSPGAIPFSGTAPTISVNVTPTSNTTYSIATLSNTSCTSIASDLTGTRIINVNAITSGTTTQTQCDGSYLWSGPLGNGQTYTASNSTATFVSGCHTQTLNLTINQSTASSQSVTACDSYTWTANGTTYTASGTYEVTGLNAAGCTDTKTLILTINTCQTVLNVKMMIQGYYAGSSTMTAAKFNELATTTATDVDDITVELRNSITYAVVATTTSLLNTNGDAQAIFAPAVGNSSYYIAIKHRNTLETWSANPVSFGGSPISYDFTTSANKAFGDNMVELGSGLFGFYTGDINQDGNVDNLDYSDWELQSIDFEPSTYYRSGDLNGDGNVDNLDYSVWELTAGDISLYSKTPEHP